MKLPIIRDCGCFSLRTGCIIIAMSELIYAVLRLYDGGRVVHDLFALHGDNPDASEKFAESKGYGYISEFGQMYFWFHAAALVSNFICAALLVHGVRTKNHSFFMPWLAGHFVVTVVFWAVALIVTLSSFTSIGTRNGDTGFAAACFCLLAFIYLGYIFTVVYSYYKQLEQEARARRLSAPLEIQVCVPPFVEDLPPTYEEVVKVNLEQKGEPLLHNVV